jgi:gas vesicle protein
MNAKTHQLKSGLMRVLLVPLVCLLLVFTAVIPDTAIAASLNSLAATTQTTFSKSVPGSNALSDSPVGKSLQSLGTEAGTALQQLAQQTQTTFDQYIQDTQTAIKDLPQKLAEAGSTTSSQFQQELETRKDLLDDAADNIDSLSGKIKKLGSGLSEASIKSAQKIFDDASDAIEVLADDIEDAEKGSSAVLRAQIDQHIQSVNQALDQAKQSFQNLTQSPA